MSNKLGVALVKELCVICTKEVDGSTIINSKLTEGGAKKVEDMHGKVIGFAEKPCEECQELLNKSFIFVEYDESLSDMSNLPQGFWRTGNIVGVKKEADLVLKIIKDNPLAKNYGFIFLDKDFMAKVGLIPKE